MNQIIIPGWLTILILMIRAAKVMDLQAGWSAEQPAYPITHPSSVGR
ncbi:hypothetical protein ACQCLI_18305 [Pseudomonas nitroreducens]|nr:hypothetical protein [Pseudomonas nitroreducens]